MSQIQYLMLVLSTVFLKLPVFDKVTSCNHHMFGGFLNHVAEEVSVLVLFVFTT